MNRKMIVLLLLGLLAIAGCGSDDNPSDPNNSGGTGNSIGGTVTATIDGVAWSSLVVQAAVNGGVFGVGASDSNTDNALGFGWVGAGTGTFVIGTGNAATGTLTHLGGSTWQAGGALGSGVITVTTSTATRVAGTFSFTAPRISGTEDPAVLVVTNGVFDAEIQP